MGRCTPSAASPSGSVRGEFVAIMGASGSGKSTLRGAGARPEAARARRTGRRRARHFPNQLSGGQQQRVAIDIFQRLNDAGMTIVMVTHEQASEHDGEVNQILS